MARLAVLAQYPLPGGQLEVYGEEIAGVRSTGTWRVCTAEGRRARCRASGWTSSPTIVGRSGLTV